MTGGIVDPNVRRLLAVAAIGDLAGPGEIALELLRRSSMRLAEVADVRDEPIGRTADLAIPAPGGPIRLRLYVPAGAEGRETPGLVFFHGGAIVSCSIETHEGLCRMLANASGCRIVSVDYRLAPEHRFPAALEDCHAAAQWVFRNARALDVDPRRIGVGGDSAGGTFAALVCHMARESGDLSLAVQLLLCPIIDACADTPSRQAYGEGYFLRLPLLDWALDQYCRGVERSDWRISPLRAPSFAGLPPAHIHTAEFDPLRDEGEAYAARLSKAGVAVEYTCHPGMIHHFYCLAGAIPAARTAVAAAGAAVGRTLALSRR